MLRVTVDDVMSWRPCGWDGDETVGPYNRRYVEKLFGRRKYMTAERVLSLRCLPVVDKLWALARPELLPRRTLQDFWLWCAGLVFKSDERRGVDVPREACDALDAVGRFWGGVTPLDAAEEAWRAVREISRCVNVREAWDLLFSDVLSFFPINANLVEEGVSAVAYAAKMDGAKAGGAERLMLRKLRRLVENNNVKNNPERRQK